MQFRPSLWKCCPRFCFFFQRSPIFPIDIQYSDPRATAWTLAPHVHTLRAEGPARAALVRRLAVRQVRGARGGCFDSLGVPAAWRRGDIILGVMRPLAPVKFQPTPTSVEGCRTVIAEKVALIEGIPTQHLDDVQAAVWRAVLGGGEVKALSLDSQRYGFGYKQAAKIARNQWSMARAVMENARRLGTWP